MTASTPGNGGRIPNWDYFHEWALEALGVNMAEKNGCNKGTPAKPSGQNSTRMNPNAFARNNLAKGGVNAFMKKKK